MFARLISIPSILFFTLNLAYAGESPKVQLLRKSHNWNSFSYRESDEQVCYLISKSEPYQVILTNRSKTKTKEWSHNVITVISKMNFKPKSKLILETDRGKRFELLTEQNTAWASSEQDDFNIRMALSESLKLNITGKLVNETSFNTQISLIGFQKAVNIIDQRCPYLTGKNPTFSDSAPSKFGSKRLPDGIQ